MNETILRIKSVFDATGAEKAASKMEKLQQALKSMSSGATRANGIFTNFFAGLTRIAKLRMLRGIIRSITSAFKEGTENIYRYSQAMGAADASHFANTMDSLASSFLYMKNSIGAVVAPLLTSLLPTIQTIINAFVTATQVVAQFFAALGGQVTYTRAKEHATVWKDVGNAAGGAAAAAKEYKNTILSFDEIHALNDVPTPGGGGGGGGAATPDYSDMFEEASISPKIQKLVEWLKKNWKDILDIVIAIGAAMELWKIANGVLKFFDALGLLKNATGVAQLTLGLILTVVGVTLSAKGGFDIGYEGADLMNVIKTALGIGLAGAGGALAAKGITALGIATVGTGVGAVFGIGIALVGTIIGFTIGEGKAQREAIISNLESYDGEFSMLMNRQNSYVAEAESAWADYNAVLGKAETARIITEQLDGLAKKASLTNGEIELSKTLINQLNNLGLDGIRAEWNETTGKIEINTQEIYNNIEAIKEEARQIANKRILTKAYEDQGDALVDLATAQRMVSDATSAYNNKLSQYQGIADTLGISLEELGKQHWFQSIYLADETYALGQANMALDTASGRYNDAATAIKDTTKALGFETNAVNGSKDATNDASDAVSDITGKFDGMSTSASGARGSIVDLNAVLASLGGMSINDWVEKGLWGIYNSAYYAKWELLGVLDYVRELSKASLTGFAIAISGLPAKAGGGFVNGYANGGIIPRFDGGGINSADLFLARENNAPELVGRIGNRTAVANQDQMVDVLTAGVIRGLSMMQEGQGSSNTEVNVYMDRQVLARAVDKGNRSLNRRFNVSLA